MADYYPLIARAVAGLEKNTGENRRALYERARTALVAQLRGVTIRRCPKPRSRASGWRSKKSIRKVEAEAARRGRDRVPRAEPPAAKPEPRVPMPPRAIRDDRPPPERPRRSRHRPRTPSRTVTDEGLKGIPRRDRRSRRPR